MCNHYMDNEVSNASLYKVKRSIHNAYAGNNMYQNYLEIIKFYSLSNNNNKLYCFYKSTLKGAMELYLGCGVKLVHPPSEITSLYIKSTSLAGFFHGVCNNLFVKAVGLGHSIPLCRCPTAHASTAHASSLREPRSHASGQAWCNHKLTTQPSIPCTLVHARGARNITSLCYKHKTNHVPEETGPHQAET